MKYGGKGPPKPIRNSAFSDRAWFLLRFGRNLGRISGVISSRTQAHDYGHLTKRWRRLAKRHRFVIRDIAHVWGLPVYELRRKLPGAPRVYLSAGVHGDEPAATEALIEWAERGPKHWRAFDLTIFPCMNPWGLVHNSRTDEYGRDLNRCYNRRDIDIVDAHLRAIAGDSFDLALTLHEDYDAAGLYIYEVATGRKPYWAETLLEAARPFVPPDSRRRIEGRKASGGVVRRKISPDLMPDWPEAFVLHFHHARRTFTIETPSEFHIDQRVGAQIAVIDRALACLGEEFESRSRGARARVAP